MSPLNSVRIVTAIRLYMLRGAEQIDSLGKLKEVAVFIRFEGTDAVVEVKPMLRETVDLTVG